MCKVLFVQFGRFDADLCVKYSQNRPETLDFTGVCVKYSLPNLAVLTPICV